MLKAYYSGAYACSDYTQCIPCALELECWKDWKIQTIHIGKTCRQSLSIKPVFQFQTEYDCILFFEHCMSSHVLADSSRALGGRWDDNSSMAAMFPIPTARRWREAASLIVAARRAPSAVASSPQSCSDYNVLLMRRGGTASFAKSMHVFPGGLLDVADTDSEWIERFSHLLHSRSDRDKTLAMLSSTACCNEKRKPPTFARRRLEDEKIGPFSLPAEVAFKICSLRETFEESGILLARHEGDKSYQDKVLDTSTGARASAAEALSMSSSDRSYWTEKVRGNASEFLNMCRSLNCVPDIWSIHLWSTWLTPSNSSKRFDTPFFLTMLTDVPDVCANAAEHQSYTWQDPCKTAEALVADELELGPPQAMELLRLARHCNSNDLLQFSADRAREYGSERWCPVRVKCTNGNLSLFPGDSQCTNYSSGDVVACTGEEFLSRSCNVHALFMKNVKDFRFYGNIPERRGHLFPVPYQPIHIPDSDAV